MIKIESTTLEQAYSDAASSFECSVTELIIEVVQAPTRGFFGMFKRSAIIVAAKKIAVETKKDELTKKIPQVKVEKEISTHTVLNDTIMPLSFVNDQDDEENLGDGLEYTADYDDEFDEDSCNVKENVTKLNLTAISQKLEVDINLLFKLICFNIEKIEVKPYDDETILVEFTGDDAALLIGKEGYRYKALSYMIFNWINSKYDVQLRLEIAEFLQNQEESISRYLVNVFANIDREGRAQTKILDGVLVQIALKELRDRYPDKYVVIRSTKDGLKYIIVNDYHNN